MARWPLRSEESIYCHPGPDRTDLEQEMTDNKLPNNNLIQWGPLRSTPEGLDRIRLVREVAYVLHDSGGGDVSYRNGQRRGTHTCQFYLWPCQIEMDGNKIYV